ncbi:hypothetical protein ACI7BZ_03405 [Xanthobacter sp. AM11]|uniref:hypothetical protein n=1 Tax=Xanthobacter sp. AM11 TaxID=3380643 RepID=UPI0039BF8688
MVETILAAQDAAGTQGAQPASPADAAGAVTPQMCLAALERVLAAPDFSASPRLADFLRFVVQATLDGRAEEIKGYTIAVEALGRPASFDPQADPIVRVEATRLRRALERYYATGGADDPVVIDIPKGGYVPQFLPRAAPVPEAPAVPEEPAAPAPEELFRPAPATQPGGGRRLAAAAFVAVAAAGLAMLAAALMGFRIERGAEDYAGGADAVRFPVVEVRPFEAAGTGAPDPSTLRAIEERMRDAFARFDFVDVKAAGASGPDLAAACGTSAPRSVFALAGLVEGRPDGSYSLAARLNDRCDGSIVWSTAIDGLQQGAALAEGERRVVHDIAVAVMESYGVIPVRARAAALARAPASGFGCIAGAFAVLRGEAGKRTENVNACLAELIAANPDFALGHALKAASALTATLHDETPTPTHAEMEQILDGAERAVELAPASAFAARTLAVVQLFAGEPDDAVATARRALQLNPLDFDVAASAAIVFIGAGQVAEGEALLLRARKAGAARTPLHDAFLALAAFLRDDRPTAQALLPQLTLHSAFESKLALALSLHTLGRTGDERDVVAALVGRMPDGAEGVRQMVRRLLPTAAHASRALEALESAGLARESIAEKPPRG